LFAFSTFSCYTLLTLPFFHLLLFSQGVRFMTSFRETRSLPDKAVVDDGLLPQRHKQDDDVLAPDSDMM
jgi:hypothetical protein